MGTFASVVLERLTGWLVLPIITLVGFAVNPGLRHLGSATRVALLLAAERRAHPRVGPAVEGRRVFPGISR